MAEEGRRRPAARHIGRAQGAVAGRTPARRHAAAAHACLAAAPCGNPGPAVQEQGRRAGQQAGPLCTGGLRLAARWRPGLARHESQRRRGQGARAASHAHARQRTGSANMVPKCRLGAIKARRTEGGFGGSRGLLRDQGAPFYCFCCLQVACLLVACLLPAYPSLCQGPSCLPRIATMRVTSPALPPHRSNAF
jgi:hypothetical protein